MTPQVTFEELAQRPDEALDVALGAALIARDVYETLDVAALLAELDELAGPLGGGALAGLPLARQAEALRERFRELGFRGNTGDYYDVRNSLLPDVIERRTGIPITLSLVWCEIARRSGVFARGVSFPGHFLARIDELPALSGRGAASSAPLIVDPFNDTRTVTDPAAAALPPATSRVTLVRMLANLKGIWTARGETRWAFVALHRMVSLRPDAAELLRERGALAARLGLRDLARRDLERALELEPDVETADLRRQLGELARRGAPRAN